MASDDDVPAWTLLVVAGLFVLMGFLMGYRAYSMQVTHCKLCNRRAPKVQWVCPECRKTIKEIDDGKK